MYKRIYILFVFCCLLLMGCSDFRKLHKTQPTATLSLPLSRLQEAPKRAVLQDSVVEKPQEFVFTRADGLEVPLNVSAEWDSINNMSVTSVALDEVVISATTSRNTAERDGKINVEFVVTVPAELQKKKWMLDICPVLSKGGVDEDSLKEIRFTGANFREKQENDYKQYDRFQEKIIPDSVDFYSTFVNYHGFEYYLNRIHFQKMSLERKWASLEAERKSTNSLWERYAATERLAQRKDSLLQVKYRMRAEREIKMQQERYDKALAELSDTTRYLNPYLLDRFSFFNNKVENHESWFEKIRNLLPARRIARELPDSVWAVAPRERAKKRFEEAQFDSLETLAKYQVEYEQRRQSIFRYDREGILAKMEIRDQHYQKKQGRVQLELDRINSLDSAEMMKRFYNTRKIARNEVRKAQKEEKYRELVRFPYNPDAKLDTVIHSADKVLYFYSEKVQADENTSRMKVYLTGNVVDYAGNSYALPTSDTLTYFVSSMTKFVDERPRYVQRIVTRDAEANATVNFVFPTAKVTLDRSVGNNSEELARVKEIARELMTDPVYIIDSLTLFAGSSPEGDWKTNGRLAKERAESIREILEKDFKVLYDSLNISMSMMLDEQGNVLASSEKNELPDLPGLLRVKWTAENWKKLSDLLSLDKQVEHREEILEIIRVVKNPDEREAQIKRRYPKDYTYMRNQLYPEVRSVDFLFSLHRRGMQRDTMYTQEIDRNYAEGVEMLKKRKYAEALDILRPYEDVNTAIAYMSQGYDKAALRLMERQSETAEVRYLQAILEYRLGDEKNAVLQFLRACELNELLKFRGNLDPELSTLIRKYGLFKEDDNW